MRCGSVAEDLPGMEGVLGSTPSTADGEREKQRKTSEGIALFIKQRDRMSSCYFILDILKGKTLRRYGAFLR